MKNLATCKPTEFVAQTAKIKGAVKNWMDVIDLVNVRAIQPQYIPYPLDATVEQKAAIRSKNAEIRQKQAMENLNKILDNMLVMHPEETLNVLALCCFVEPEHVDDYTMNDYLECIMEMMQCKGVIDFFSFLAQIQTVAKPMQEA